MGDFNEHILFGFLLASVIFFSLNNYLSLTRPQIILSSAGILIGSILPDIDHKNSKIHRSARSSLSLAFGAFFGYLAPINLGLRIFVMLLVSTAIYSSFKFIKIKHRGFTHSISFGTIVASSAVIIGVLTTSSPVPGVAVGIGIASHLILDTELKLS